jgi:hypothetical protein
MLARKTSYSEAWIQHKSGSRCVPPIIIAIHNCQRSREKEMSDREISIGLDAAAQPRNGFLIRAHLRFSVTYPHHPHVRVGIARGETERLKHMSFGFSTAAADIFGKTYKCVSEGQVSIQRQRSLTFGDALSGAF